MYRTIRELAKAIGVPYYRIQYAHEQGLLPEPMRIGGRRVYDEEAAQRVRQYFLEIAKKQLANMETVSTFLEKL